VRNASAGDSSDRVALTATDDLSSGSHIVPYEVMRMSEGTPTTTHERLARIKENYWGCDWDIARMLSAANRNYGEHPSESDE
jgi:hypothetical protein